MGVFPPEKKVISQNASLWNELKMTLKFIGYTILETWGFGSTMVKLNKLTDFVANSKRRRLPLMYKYVKYGNCIIK